MPEIPEPSAFALKVAQAARKEHHDFSGIDENDDPLRSRIKDYWAAIPQAFPGVEVPWSAAFISFCVRQGGATNAQFHYAAAHSVFVFHAINSPGAYTGQPLNLSAVNVGDIIQNNRGGSSHDFAFAKAHQDYISHSSIVVARGVDHLGKFAQIIGGNENDSVRMTTIRLEADGTVKQRASSPFIAHLKVSI